MSCTAINSKHQTAVNRFIKAANHYSRMVETCDGSAKEEKAYNRASNYWDALPKREQANISKTTQHNWS